MTTVRRRVAAVLFALGVAAVTGAGCGPANKEKPVFKVQGKLSFDGKAMDKAEIAFIPTDPNERGLQARATANGQGEYTLYTYRKDDGAPAGEYVVTIFWPGPLSKKAAEKLEKAETLEEKDSIVPPDRLKGVYSNALTSKLRATVEAKDNTIDFKLP